MHDWQRKRDAEHEKLLERLREQNEKDFRFFARAFFVACVVILLAILFL